METVNNIVSGASKVIWGEGNTAAGQEPVSGKQGAGTAGEPYDKGNEDSTTTTTTDSTTTPATTTESTKPKDAPTTSGTADSTGANVNTDLAGAELKAKRSEPLTDEEREKLAEAEKLPHDPNDHSGEPMKMHGGGADPEAAKENETMQEKTERSKSVAHEGGGEHGKEQGTGEKWEKSTGMSAEGGDFDATKPGAGKEATRLLEQKGIKHDGDNHGAPSGDLASPSTSSVQSGDSPGKVSKMAKLKEKLHIGSKKGEDSK